MAAASWDITFEENSEFSFYVKDLDSACNPKDITDYVALLHVRAEKDFDSPIILEASSVDSTILIQEDGATGQLHVLIPMSTVRASKSNWPPSLKGFYDLLIYPPTPGSGPKRLLQGVARFSLGVTDPVVAL